jgi:putative membrane-bound dehydrogenase-like protein
MKQRQVPGCGVLAIAAAISVCSVGSTSRADEVTIGDRVLRVADGFTVELVTTPELVERPIAVARDERGRLYVTDSGGMTENAAAQLEKKPHRIRRLEDTDGDGDYDHSTLFADRMMFPEGCMWYDGSLYVAAPPEIWKLTDVDDDGIADRREVWFDGTTLTGCGNDLHGPYLGPDGRFYWCKGAFAEQKHAAAGGTTFETRASHIFRAKPDGTELEAVLTGGMDNPVNVAFLENGERFLSCTFFQHPEAGRRDGLIHAIYGGVYGKEHDVILSHPRTGSVMPVLNHQGAAAPCGLIAGSRSLFGKGYDQHLFACYFNLHKVVMHRLIPDGPTYTTEDADLLACDHPDFHPTDVFEDADGSLLIVDTGGWYKVCCPTSQLAKPDVLGAIYCVRRKDQPAVDDPLGLQLEWSTASPVQLVDRLSDSRLFVQRRATAALRKGGDDGVKAIVAKMQSEPDEHVRAALLWTLSALAGQAAGEARLSALKDKSPLVQQIAAESVALAHNGYATWKAESVARVQNRSAFGDGARASAIDQPPTGPSGTQTVHVAGALATLMLSSPGTSQERSAASALAVIGDPSVTPTVFHALPDVPAARRDSSGAPAESGDRITEHALIHALIRTNHPGATRAGAVIAEKQKEMLDTMQSMPLAWFIVPSDAVSKIERTPMLLKDARKITFDPAKPMVLPVDPAILRALLVALDQMPSGDLTAEEVIGCLSHEDAAVRATAVWIIEQHPDWGDALVGHFEQRGGKLDTLSADEREQDRALLVSLADSPPIQSLLQRWLDDPSQSATTDVALNVLASVSLSSAPESWLDSLARQLTGVPADRLPLRIDAARRLPQPKDGHAALRSALQQVAAREDVAAEWRLAAWDASGANGELSPSTFELLLSLLGPEQPLNQRSSAAQGLAAAALTAEQRTALLATLPDVGAMELPKLLPAFERDPTDAQGHAVITALQGLDTLNALRADQLQAVLAKYSPTVQEAARPLLKRLNASLEEQTAQLERLLAELPEGDVQRGHEVFMSRKAACSTCHKLGYSGGTLGPDLSSLGRVRNRRDVLEALVFPSASIVRGYEPVIAELSDGRVVGGIITSESGHEITISTDAQKSTVISRADIEAMTPSSVSPMPNGLATLLTPQELADLVTFLVTEQRGW